MRGLPSSSGLPQATATAARFARRAPYPRFLTVNRRFAELFGVEPGEVLGRDFDELQELVERIFADPTTIRALVSGTASDRTRRFSETVDQRWPARRALELSSTPVESTAGQPLGRLYTFRDVTRERAVDRMKSEFVALVSHELRTPLTSIKGYVELLLADEVDGLTEEQREFLHVVAHNADRLTRLIQDLLDISHIESGQIELNYTAVDVNRVIREVSTSLRPQIKGKGQRLVVRVAKGLPAVWGDEDRLAQILVNLVSNAHKYTPEGGQITVEARPEGDMLRIDIEDTGIGLSEEELAQLFTRFFRAKNRMMRGAGGTGRRSSRTACVCRLGGMPPNRATSGFLPGRSVRASKQVRGPCGVMVINSSGDSGISVAPVLCLRCAPAMCSRVYQALVSG